MRLRLDEDIVIIVYDIFQKDFMQELLVNKREYLILMNEFLKMNIAVPEVIEKSNSAMALKNLKIDIVDFEYLIDIYLSYDDIIQSFIFTSKQKEGSKHGRKPSSNTLGLGDAEGGNFVGRSVGTSRSSLVTESVTKVSAAFKLNTGLLSMTTFAKRSDTSKVGDTEEYE